MPRWAEGFSYHTKYLNNLATTPPMPALRYCEHFSDSGSRYQCTHMYVRARTSGGKDVYICRYFKCSQIRNT